MCFAAASSEQAAPLVGFGTRDRQSIFWDDNSSERDFISQGSRGEREIF